jgi:nucleoid DNA-binding protein
LTNFIPPKPLDHTGNHAIRWGSSSGHAVTEPSLGVKALIKQDIIHQVIAKTGLPRNKAEAAVDTVFESLKKALASGDRIELRGFGVFNVRPRKTGIGRNPRTGAEVTITPGKAVRFKPGKELHLLDS